MSDTIRYTQADGLAQIVLDDGKVNAMDGAFFDGLNAALDRAERDAARALVLAGRAGFLSPGLNVKLLPTLPREDYERTLMSFGRTLLRLWTAPQPTVAAVTGHAVAGGALLAFACDHRVVADAALRIQMNETAIGLPLPTWAMVICQSAIPVRWQTEAILHARGYTPAEALERGMIDEVVPADAVLARARAAATALAVLHRDAYAASKRRLRAHAVAWAERHLEDEMLSFKMPGA
jgi:enoyl-CoA hydratase